MFQFCTKMLSYSSITVVPETFGFLKQPPPVSNQPDIKGTYGRFHCNSK